MTPVQAIFGIEAGTLNTIVQLVLLAVVVVWLALVWYTFADARRRLDDQLLIGSAVLASLLFPFLGTIVYMIVRPPEYLEDVRERELEMEAAQARLASLDYQLCPHCDAPGGARLPALPALPAQAPRHVRDVQPPAGPRLDDLPVLRIGDPGRHAAAAEPPARRERRGARARDDGRERAGYEQDTARSTASRGERVRPGSGSPRRARGDRGHDRLAGPAELRRGAARRRRRDVVRAAARLRSAPPVRPSTTETHGPDPDPGQAGRVRARHDR